MIIEIQQPITKEKVQDAMKKVSETGIKRPCVSILENYNAVWME